LGGLARGGEGRAAEVVCGARELTPGNDTGRDGMRGEVRENEWLGSGESTGAVPRPVQSRRGETGGDAGLDSSREPTDGAEGSGVGKRVRGRGRFAAASVWTGGASVGAWAGAGRAGDGNSCVEQVRSDAPGWA